MLKIKRLMSWLTVAAAIGIAGVTFAQEYPNKPVKLVLPFPPGGVADNMARIYSQELSKAWQQSVVVENRPGAGTTIGAEFVAKSPADGYTIFFGTISTLATNVATSKKLPYDPVKDFAPITLTSSNPYFMVVHPSVPANSVKEFMALAKAKPGQITYASSGAGGGSHMAMELFRTMANLDMLHIPYKGSGQSVTEVVAGQVQMTFIQPSITISQAKAGKLKVLAVTSKTRLASWKEAPPIGDSVPGYEANSWQGVVAPAGTPKPIINRLHTEIVKALRSPEITGRLVAEGSEIGGISPDEFGRYIRTEITKWKKVVVDAKIQVE